MPSEGSRENEKLMSVKYRPESFLGVDWGTVKDLSHPLVLLPELPTESTNPLAKAAVLERQLEALSAQYAAIRAWRNRFMPIACLDDDLLSEIFQCVALTHPSDTSRSRSWTSLMLVCRRWRAIGVCNSVLWSSVIVGGKRLVKPSPLHMQRSGMRPLTVHIDLSANHFIGPYADYVTTPATLLKFTLSILKPHFDRVRALDITAAREELSQFLFHLGRTKRPNLRCLRVAFDFEEACTTFLPLAFELSVTQNLIARAEVVTLTDAVVFWTDLRNLTILRVQLDPSRSRDAYAHKMSCTTAIIMLRFSPALEELVLQNCFKHSPLEIDFTSTSPPVHLPVLRICNLSASGSVCATILAATRRPPSARIHVTVTESDWDEHAVQVLLEVLQMNFAQPGAPTLRVLQIIHQDSGATDSCCYQWHRWFTDVTLDHLEPSAEPSAGDEVASFSLRMPAFGGQHGRWPLQQALRSVPAKAVQVCELLLCAPIWKRWPRNDVRDLLWLLPGLQSLVVRYKNTGDRVRVRATWQLIMRDVCDALPEQESPKGRTVYWTHNLNQYLQGEFTKKLKDLVDAQMLAGRPLQRLVLHPQFLGQKHLKILSDRWASRVVKVGTEETTFIEVELV
ncbi:uncharacterized protein SCHCODRAFT_02621336 [Schizophyllum commune H4-8]|nr:uncharacterized protein SCHCODRAFT_02621336 [Schizophyllum commune H4-8]KAI5893277.1 hypothetical protein SCHCODRAFT_02621336 [Schizophyllum commune H4-8]